jgi:hypothetical protein
MSTDNDNLYDEKHNYSLFKVLKIAAIQIRNQDTSFREFKKFLTVQRMASGMTFNNSFRLVTI